MKIKENPDFKNTIYFPAAKAGADPDSLSGELLDRIESAIKKTHKYYISEQHEEGYWWYELESNVTITAEYLMLLHFLGLKDKDRDDKIAKYIIGKQRPDGTWAIHWGGKGDLSTTVEAYFALKLAGISADEPFMRRARSFILANGGAGYSRVFTKIFLALFGEFRWDDLPSLPVELMLISSPVSIYDFSSWARSTVVPLLIILDLKPVQPIPESARIGELYLTNNGVRSLNHKPDTVVKKVLSVLDRILKGLEKSPVRPLRSKGLAAAEKWILDHQEESGDWGGIQPPMVNSILALWALGYSLSSEPISKGLEALKRFTIETDGEMVLQSCISPVWDTALVCLGLQYSGMDRNHFSLMKGSRWLASGQILKKGDWSVKRPNIQPGGWAFEFENNWYPDVDDTAVVLMFLLNYKSNHAMNEKINRGIDWVLGMQGTDGGWGAFDADNNMSVLNQIPFADLEAMIDPSTPDIAGRVLEVLGKAGYGLSHPKVRRAVDYIKRNQEDDGSFWARWGVNYIYGTWSVLMGLASIGEDMQAPYVRKSVEWLKGFQNLDGGWGECCESYADRRLRGHGPSCPSQTAWALLALIAAEEAGSTEVEKGIKYLLDRQNPDGTWDEEQFTGTGFPKYFMIRYHNYRNCFPLMALGKYHSAKKGPFR